MFDTTQFIKEKTQELSEQVNGKALIAFSGGVDSTVCAALVHKAIGKNLIAVHVDTGYMRKHESKEVEQLMKRMGINYQFIDASEEFFKALTPITDPEEKRKIIGDLFLDIQQKVSDELNLNPNEWLLAQGTIYPDTIETGGTKHADTIKTHHNRVERIQKLIDAGKVLEPLAQLYKDEVRLVGERLKLGESLIWRHPFPGPGLAVRTLCAQGPDLPENFHDLEGKMNGITKDRDLQAKILPIKSVGVQGDERTYRHPAALFGEAESWDDLNKISTRLTNQFAEINRVVWALNPAIIEDLTTQNSYINPGRISIIQRADRIVMDFIKEAKIDRDIWQFPTVLIPVGKEGRPESIVLRPVCSQEAMTADFYKMDFDLLNELVKRLMTLEGVFGIFYDITNKPPGTIEWE